MRLYLWWAMYGIVVCPICGDISLDPEQIKLCKYYNVFVHIDCCEKGESTLCTMCKGAKSKKALASFAEMAGKFLKTIISLSTISERVWISNKYESIGAIAFPWMEKELNRMVGNQIVSFMKKESMYSIRFRFEDADLSALLSAVNSTTYVLNKLFQRFAPNRFWRILEILREEGCNLKEAIERSKE